MATEFHTSKRWFYTTGILVALLVVSSLQLVAGPLKSISRPEKVWSIFHPFKAIKVLKCARRSQFVTDSLEKAGTLTDDNGGQLDAFRHAYWMALMINEGMKESVVRKIGTRHEKGNYIDFKKSKLEDSNRADSMMCVMDLRNNEVGIVIGQTFRDEGKKLSLIEAVMNEVWNGNLFIMSKNANGDYLDEKGEVIDLKLYTRKWYIPKHPVKSNMVVVKH